MPILSIIVPVYNKENYIDDCIRSILAQSLTDFELILVNDGSTDGSLPICEGYQRLDDRVFIINQKNQGVSAARNAGISKATGMYMGFIDCDDTIEPDMYELLMNNALTCNADVSVCRIRTIFPYKTVAPVQDNHVATFDYEEALSAFFDGTLDMSANNKIYKTNMLQHIRFSGRMYEDILYLCYVFLKAGKTVLQNTIKYNYILRDSSVSMKGFNPVYFETVEISDKMVALVSGQEQSAQIINAVKNFDVMANISLLNLLLMTSKEKYREQYDLVVNKLLGYKAFIAESSTLRKKYRYAYKAFTISPPIYATLMYYYCQITASEVLKRT